MTDENQDNEGREQDRFLPIANISRIMKKALPPNAKISKDAKECVQECVSEFISFITSEACEKCLSERRKTINGDDLLHAMTTLGFEKYIDPLRLYLQRYREVTKTDKPEENSAVPGTSQDYSSRANPVKEDSQSDEEEEEEGST